MTGILRYSPGSSFLIVGPTVVAITTDESWGHLVWPLIAQGFPAQQVLEHALSGGLGQLPDFLLMEFDRSDAPARTRTRVVARGAHSARVRRESGEVLTCSGENVSTWTERVVDDASSAAVNSTAGNTLPIVIGMVRAAGFTWSASDNAPEPHLGTIAAPTRVPTIDAREELGVELVDEPIKVPTRPLHRPGLAETRTEPADDGFDHLFGSTVYRSVEDAAVRDMGENHDATVDAAAVVQGSPSKLGSAEAPATKLGDHDGSTIMASELAALRSAGAKRSTSELANVVVPISDGPPPAVLVLSTGEHVALDRDVVIGRRPQVDRVAGSAIPRLITVESPQQDISRSHLQITRERDGFIAKDLHSVNGTVVIRGDESRLTLVGGDQATLRIGDVLDLGDGVTITMGSTT